MRIVLAAVATVVVLSAGALSGTNGAEGAAHCALRGAHGLGADRYGAIAKQGTGYYACPHGSRPLALGSDRCFARPGAEAVGPPQLAGPFAVFWTRRCGVDTAFAGIRSVDLRTRSRTIDVPATTTPQRPETVESVLALHARRDGAVAWIVDSHSLATSASRRELWVVDSHRRQRRLDSGRGLDPRSLRVAARSVRWRNGAASRSASVG